MSRSFLELDCDGENETVEGKTENRVDYSKSDNVGETKNQTKRTWTPARELAWAKCQKGREEYIKTKKELTEKELESTRMKDKVRLEMLKKKIRLELVQEMQTEQKQNSSDEGDEEKINQEEKEEKMKIEPKKIKKKRVILREEVSDSSSSSSSESDTERRRKKTKRAERRKKQKKSYSSSESEEETPKLKKRSKSIRPTLEAPTPYLSRFAFV